MNKNKLNIGKPIDLLAGIFIEGTLPPSISMHKTRPCLSGPPEVYYDTKGPSLFVERIKESMVKGEYKVIEVDSVPEHDDTTVLVFDRADFLHGIDKDDMVPALVLCDRKADTLLRKVVENSVDNLQTFLSTGVMPGTDYSLFSEVVSFDDEDDAESVVTPAAGQIINRMVMMADNLLKDTIDPNVLRDADITTVNIKSNRLEITISK